MPLTATPPTQPETARRTAPWLMFIGVLLIGLGLLALYGPRIVPLLGSGTA